LPILQGQLEMWRHLAFMEAVVNCDEHPDQLHPVDTMLRKFGIDPATIDPALKVITPVFTPGERQRALALRPQGRFGVYQLATTSPTRSMSPDQAISTLNALATQHRNVSWLVIYDRFVPEATVARAKAIRLPNVAVRTFNSIRVIWAIVATADVCVGPDSMLIHIAGSMGTPTVGLWGPMRPSSRVKYYRNHIPIWHQSSCQFAPCFKVAREFPRYCPPMPEPRQVCAVLGDISGEEVCDAVAKALFCLQ
jgi:ADP-heptose:LPS heptosyltransferase